MEACCLLGHGSYPAHEGPLCRSFVSLNVTEVAVVGTYAEGGVGGGEAASCVLIFLISDTV